MKDTDYIGLDKAYHLLVCLAIALYSTEAAIAAALAKEYGDHLNRSNHWCWWDVAADSVGIALGTAVRVLVIRRWNWI